MKLQKTVNILFMLCFLGFLFIGMAVTVVKPKDNASYFENRTLAAVPDLSRQSLWNGSWFSGWESYLKDHAAGRETLLKTATYLDLFVIKRPVVNNIVVTDRLLLSYNAYKPVDLEEIAEDSQKMTDSLETFNQIVAENGGVFYYVAVPGQTAYFSGDYPAYLNSQAAFTAAALASFKADMSSRGLKLIDMGDVFDAMGRPAGMFSSTDHHYTFDGAFATYRTIMERLNTDDRLALPILSPDDITVKTVENPFIGSRGREIFNMLPTDEKLKIAVLKKDIPFTRTDDGKDGAPQVYALPQNTWDTVSYTVYMGGDVGETVIKTDRPDLPNVLICGDSYTNAVETLLYTGFNEMRSLDLRSYTAGSLADYVRDYKPDVVILLRDYSVLLSSDGNGNVLTIPGGEYNAH
ncbi:SGNH hydrolase-like domain-containing protein, acetyltransferase AlgX [Sporobacter termitidis DSM 10068]|uniref:SGNH hydrolase-like domain-containing protein, acetyltransferase AlgX n=1 Tax=Sporobacter termitidis DSM 10068 TaxID=1123282 RepID=A0A1M5Z9U4_9FIRM|nr:hypothetical protein [Sporobacter termitidis]SHI20898.1 SGNH hydrolase-like domain-containing protein, acetyltransferase AlgX [Sporobacter termitidis DSM 10068]